MDVWNYLNYLQSEQAALKMKYDKLNNFVEEILEALKQEEIKRLDTKERKIQSKCRYYNRGYCKEGERFSFFHSNEDCQEYIDSGNCSQGRRCWQRHPQKCKYWLRGKCWRQEACVYLHVEECVGKVDDENESVEDSDGEKEDVECIGEENIADVNEQTMDDYQHRDTTNNIIRDITTDEILKMYENIEIDLSNSEQISTDEILKMYEIDTEEMEAIANKTFNVKKNNQKTQRKDDLNNSKKTTV